MKDDFDLDMNLDDPALRPENPRSKKKYIVVVVLVLLAILAAAFFIMRNSKKSPETVATNNSAASESKPEKKTSLRFIATGDMIPHDAINKAAKQPDSSYDYSNMYGDTKKWFTQADVRFCNQPTLAGGTEFGVSGYPDFNAPLEFTKSLHGIGCNLVNIGSNHTNDKTQAVIDATIDGWKDLPNVYSVIGANRSKAEKERVAYFEVEGVRFAFVSYTTYTNKKSPNGYSVTMYSDDLAKQQLDEARSKADVVIVSMRWGTEYSDTVNASQRAIAKKLSGLGADIIVGHGPHVLQPVEVIGDTVVWYSLGNYFNAQLEAEGLFNGIAVMDIALDSKKVTVTGYLPVYMHYEWSAAEKSQQDLLARHNFSMFTLDQASEKIPSSQLNTSVEKQNARIKKTLQSTADVPLLTLEQYAQ